MWCALIEKIRTRAEEMAGEKRWLVVLEATTYTRIYGQQQLGKCWCVIIGKILVVKLYSRKIFSYVFVYENIFTMKKQITVMQFVLKLLI